jgi:hypothetical protein
VLPRSEEAPCAIPSPRVGGCFFVIAVRDRVFAFHRNTSDQDCRSIIEHLEAGGEQERQVAEAMRIVRVNGANRVYTAGR